MARRRAQQQTPEGRFLASRIIDAQRKGLTRREIKERFGVPERTQRKLISGETSGKRIYRERVAPSQVETGNRSIVRLDLVVGYDEKGNEIVRTVNAKTPLVNGRTPTPFDVLRLPGLQQVADAELRRLRNQYAGSLVIVRTGANRISSLRPIRRRDAGKRLVTIPGAQR